MRVLQVITKKEPAKGYEDEARILTPFNPLLSSAFVIRHWYTPEASFGKWI